MEKNTKANVIVGGSNVSGNIGSCSIESNEVKTQDRIWTADYSVIQINSCTGEIVAQYQYTSYFGVWITICLGLCLGLLMLLFHEGY